MKSKILEKQPTRHYTEGIHVYDEAQLSKFVFRSRGLHAEHHWHLAKRPGGGCSGATCIMDFLIVETQKASSELRGVPLAQAWNSAKRLKTTEQRKSWFRRLSRDLVRKAKIMWVKLLLWDYVCSGFRACGAPSRLRCGQSILLSILILIWLVLI